MEIEKKSTENVPESEKIFNVSDKKTNESLDKEDLDSQVDEERKAFKCRFRLCRKTIVGKKNFQNHIEIEHPDHVISQKIADGGDVTAEISKSKENQENCDFEVKNLESNERQEKMDDSEFTIKNLKSSESQEKIDDSEFRVKNLKSNDSQEKIDDSFKVHCLAF